MWLQQVWVLLLQRRVWYHWDKAQAVLAPALLSQWWLAGILILITAMSIAELNALMLNLSGGLAQYTLVCMGPFPTIVSMIGGYLVCNILAASVESVLFSYTVSEELSPSR